MRNDKPNDEPMPLWREAIPDREPWRRGRIAVVLISIFFFAAQAAFTFNALLDGEMSAFFLQVLVGWLVCVFLFLMWIGQNWARWIVSPLIALFALCAIVWGLRASDGLTVVYGLGLAIIFAYLAVAPSVYAFARHQHENANLLQSILIGVVFLLVLASLGFGFLGFLIYEKRLERDGTRFAYTTLVRVFRDHDADYLSAHSTEQRRFASARNFMNRVEELGAVKYGGPVAAKFSTAFRDQEFEVHGTFRERVACAEGSVWVRLEVICKHHEWRIVHISWDYYGFGCPNRFWTPTDFRVKVCAHVQRHRQSHHHHYFCAGRAGRSARGRQPLPPALARRLHAFPHLARGSSALHCGITGARV